MSLAPFVVGTAETSSSSTSLSVTVPTEADNGDLLYIGIYAEDNDRPSSFPDSWVGRGSRQPFSTPPDGDSYRFGFFGSSYAFLYLTNYNGVSSYSTTWPSSANREAVCIAIRGADQRVNLANFAAEISVKTEPVGAKTFPYEFVFPYPGYSSFFPSANSNTGAFFDRDAAALLPVAAVVYGDYFSGGYQIEINDVPTTADYSKIFRPASNRDVAFYVDAPVHPRNLDLLFEQSEEDRSMDITVIPPMFPLFDAPGSWFEVFLFSPPDPGRLSVQEIVALEKRFRPSTFVEDIDASGAAHHWEFDGDYTDRIGTANGTNSGTIVTDTAIAEEATNCMTTNTIAGDRVTIPASNAIGNAALEQKAIGGWFEISEFSPHPVRIYGEGGATTGFQFALGFGNNCLLEVFGTGLTLVQVFGIPLVPNRPYYLMGLFSGNGESNEVSFYIDGVKMLDAQPSDAQPDGLDIDAHSPVEFGDPVSGSTVLGGGTVLLQAATNGQYNHWAAWSGADAGGLDQPTIRNLFEKSALADFTVTTDSQSAMQTDLDTINTTLRPNFPICIRVEEPTGDTDLELTADGITFDPLASVHVQWTGSKILTWRNDRDSNATIFSTTNGGQIVVQNETELVIAGLQNPTEVRVYEAGTINEIDGQENVTTGTFSTFLYQDLVDIVIASIDFENIFLSDIDTTADITLQITQFTDRVFENP